MHCQFCQKDLSTLNKKAHQTNCRALRIASNEHELTITKEHIYNLYIVDKLSELQIAKSLKIRKRSVKKLIEKFGIAQRTRKEINKIRNNEISLTKLSYTKTQKEAIHNKRTATVFAKYNVLNVRKSEIIKKKIIQIKSTKDKNGMSTIEKATQKTKETIRRKYGVDNVFQLESTKEKAKKTMLLKYGVPHAYHLTSIGFSKSSQELFWIIYNKLPEEIKKHCYFKELNKEFGKRDDQIDKYYFYDFVISSKRICIEFNGEKYHPNKKKLNKQEWKQWRSLFTNEDAKTIYTKDKRKLKLMTDIGYQVIVVWYKDYITNKEEIARGLIDIINKS